jgi:Spy/CpxP family protein refolding chaperone
MNLTRLAGGWLALLTIFALSPAPAQHHGSGPAESHAPGAASPYAGMQHRRIKALSDQQIADLRAGRGMGLAMAAELNGYPGPMHVLELADALKLSDEQRSRTRALFDAMKAETIPIGEKLIVEEMALDRLFAEQRVTRGTLDETTSRIAAAQGELRAAHLRYHLAMVDVLSPAQIAQYVELRGYTRGGHHGGRRHGP